MFDNWKKKKKKKGQAAIWQAHPCVWLKLLILFQLASCTKLLALFQLAPTNYCKSPRFKFLATPPEVPDERNHLILTSQINLQLDSNEQSRHPDIFRPPKSAFNQISTTEITTPHHHQHAPASWDSSRKNWVPTRFRQPKSPSNRFWLQNSQPNQI